MRYISQRKGRCSRPALLCFHSPGASVTSQADYDTETTKAGCNWLGPARGRAKKTKLAGRAQTVWGRGICTSTRLCFSGFRDTGLSNNTRE
ncbi:hypothetical protein SKAU_G00258190 [Synaphobranchus kaupii]|uniref:Uncharacterized protein n=1 Tax=Synaphobranchus kaupii TaxID=118154 RepID=A0A9Q1IQH1_SYNKA|nr:hypothetical protein SKAU_G00258190 [Synaphobranchus kaupii]